MDSNAKHGSGIVPGDPKPKSENGKLLENVVIDNDLLVVNATNICEARTATSNTRPNQRKPNQTTQNQTRPNVFSFNCLVPFVILFICTLLIISQSDPF